MEELTVGVIVDGGCKYGLEWEFGFFYYYLQFVCLLCVVEVIYTLRNGADIERGQRGEMWEVGRLGIYALPGGGLFYLVLVLLVFLHPLFP